mgnify:CR=1 FL=1|tara:strand:- start:4790 stop:6121 length:1332 start_codon:yes stop_codon:yes gene_type:complete
METDLENKLLGCVFLDNKQLSVIKPWVSEVEFFYSDFNRRVWNCMIRLDSEDNDIDQVIVASTMKKVSTDKLVGYTLTSYSEDVAAPSKAESYAKILHSEYLRRKLRIQVQKIEQYTGDDNKDTNALLEEAHTNIGNIIKLQPSKKFSLSELLENTEKSIFEQTTLVQTGINKLDSVVSGMTRGEITIIAGRPGNAKTTVAANIARNLVHQGKTVVMFNREMPNVEMMKKFMAMESAQLMYRNLRHSADISGEEVKRVLENIKKMYEDRLFMFDNIRDLESSFREVKAINPDVVIDDHIGLIEYPSNDYRDLRLKIGDTTRKYKWLAKSQEMCVILVSQMNRNMEHRNDRTPRLSDLAESGNLEQDAETVVFSHYPWVSRYGDDGNSQCYLQLIIAKNRYGTTNSINVGYEGDSCKIHDTEDLALQATQNKGGVIKKMELFDE